jgi:RNA polymerase sigma-70 factor (ECF subfamily)
MDLSDQEILKNLREGDLNAFQFLFDDNYKGLVSYARKFMPDSDIARDIVQDVFAYIWEKRSTLLISRSFKSYLYRAVHNACINYLKKEENKGNYIKEFLLKVHANAEADHDDRDAHKAFIEKDLNEKIHDAIDDLPEQCRNIFKLSRFKGLRNKEIADIYSISTRTVETQIYRAMKVMRERLKQYLVSALICAHIFFM